IMKRRDVIKGLAIFPVSGAVASTFDSNSFKPAQKVKRKSVYEPLGVKTLINARGTVTVVGASKVLPEVRDAMDAAIDQYVQIDELMDGVGKRLGELMGTESGCVTSGASAAITAGTAGCVTGGDPDKIWMIPNITGMKDEVVVPFYSRSAYDAGCKAVGVRMIEVANVAELKAALGPRTAMVYLLAGAGSESGALSLKIISDHTKPLGIPILIDAAAEGPENPNPHIVQGADLVAYSGGKYLNGPQCAGLLIGRKDLVMAARMNTGPHHGFGRGFKVGREEIIGMLTAVEMWFKRDHVGERKLWTARLEVIASRLKAIDGVITSIRQPSGRSNPSPALTVSWDQSKIPYIGQDVEDLLWNGNPRISVGAAGSYFQPNQRPSISVNSSQLSDGEEKIVADQIFAVLSKPVASTRTTGAPAANLSGQWDVETKYYAATVSQTFMIEQKGNDLKGTYIGHIGSRDLTGTIHENDILIRSTYGVDGARVHSFFTGKIIGDTMQGHLSVGEYGEGTWTANRHVFKMS
ncbi:MAG: aminotransferase class V-fold PLP-dependent enzyme, partial [Phormidesmis sp. FL-bin-119]|nr:aminotransferase class V-fold PLP-dependent enzyme [Pedobacter sp.]